MHVTCMGAGLNDTAVFLSTNSLPVMLKTACTAGTMWIFLAKAAGARPYLNERTWKQRQELVLGKGSRCERQLLVVPRAALPF